VSTISERVARGVSLLDVHLPDWWKRSKISLRRLDLADGCNCVVGQLYEPPDDGFIDGSGFETAIDTGWLDLDYPLAVSHGFYAGMPHGSATEREYVELTEEWRRVITERRAAA
jgi:hypothetical protein